MACEAVNKELSRDVLDAYLEWLHMEARLLRVELYGDDWADRELTPCNTFAKNFHIPSDGRSWRDMPQPSTRAEIILKVAGVTQ